MTQGIKRVEELFEIRNPKKPAILAPFDGKAVIVEGTKKTEIHLTSDPIPMTYVIKDGYTCTVKA